MIFRFREEIAHGRTTDDAIVETMQHAGRSVIVSGSTVAIGLVSMVILPLPFIRSIGLGGMLIPLVSVLASITLTPALLRLLGPKINRLRVMPKRLSTQDDVETGLLDALGRDRSKRPLVIFLAGMVVVVLLLIPAFQINPSDAETQASRRRPTPRGPAGAGRRGYHAGRLQAVRRSRRGHERSAKLAAIAEAVARRRRHRGRRRRRRASVAPGRRGAPRGVLARPTRRRGRAAKVISDLQQRAAGRGGRRRAGVTLTLGGAAPEERDFVHAVYGNFGWVLLFVIVLTFILLAARVPLDRAAAEGGDPQPDLARLRLRRRRVHLPDGPRQRGDLGRPGDRCRDLVDPADDLRVPLRHLDGLRGVHDHPDPRGVRRDAATRAGRSRSASPAPASS